MVLDRAFECFPTDDVLAARTCARTLLATSDAPSGLLAQARLVLTAACLHIHARIGPDPTFDELRDLLLTLRASAAAWTALAASPIQFVRYTAAELAETDGGLGSAIDLAVRALNAAAL
ncbi:MAG: hypothetical protein AB1429_10375 [Pseudomonadota bacterium]